MDKSQTLQKFASLVEEFHRRKTIKVDKKKRQVVFDYTGRKDRTFSMAGCLSWVLAVPFFLAAYSIQEAPDFLRIGLAVLGIGIILVATLYVRLNRPSDKYLFDFETEELVDIKSRKSQTRRRVLCSFENLDSLVLYSCYRIQAGSGSRFYGLSLITEAGSLLELTDRFSNQNREEAVRLGLSLSELLDVEFQQGAENTVFKYTETAEGLQYEFQPFDAPDGEKSIR